MKKEYIYALICPIDKEVKYVGKTKNPKTRYSQHIKKLDKSMTPKRIWLEMLFYNNMLPDCNVLEEVDSESARDREQFFVTKYKDTVLNIHNPEKGKKSFRGKYPTKKK